MFMMILKAFLVGGAICVVGQILIDITKLTPARILVSFVCIGVILGSLGFYDKLVEIAGAGANIPLTGFGNALALGTKRAIDEKGIIGIFTGPLSACAGGVTIALLSGLVVSLLTRSKDK